MLEAVFGAGKSVLCDEDNKLLLWDLSKYSVSPLFPLFPQPSHRSFRIPSKYITQCNRVSRGGGIVACGAVVCKQTTIRVCLLWSARCFGCRLYSVPIDHKINKLAISDDGSLVCLFGGNVMSIVGVESGEVLARYAPPGVSVAEMLRGSFSRDGRQLITAEHPCIRDVETQKPLLRVESRNVQSCAFSNDSSQAAWCGRRGRIIIADTRVAKPHTVLSNPLKDEYLEGCAFSADDKNILCCGRDGIRLFSCHTGREIAQLPGPTYPRRTWQGCDVSTDGTLFMAYDRIGVARVWDARTHKTKATYSGHNLVQRWYSPKTLGRFGAL